jgi:uncharacterized repeat protein (TIGR03803 family)
MRGKTANDLKAALGRVLTRTVAVGAITLMTLASGWASQKTLYAFRGGKDGANPHGALISDSAGNLYGTTELGGGGPACGTTGCGTVFELVKNADGGYQEQVLYRFQSGSDGLGPWAALTLDGAGNLYGTTINGGGSTNCYEGCGTAFKLTKGSTGQWTETILYAFQGGTGDGQGPAGQLLLDLQGNLYGTTLYGGTGYCTTEGCGFVFSLTPTPSGPWTETLLYEFTGAEDGGIPSPSLTVDAAGNFYGTTGTGGGLNNSGTVFELAPTGGTWSLSTLFAFNANRSSTTGQSPEGGVILDAAGNLYGTNNCGGVDVAPRGYTPCQYGFGNVFKLSPGTGGVWTEQVLYNFVDTKNAAYPDTPLVFDSAGNLYATTYLGGSPRLVGWGTVFELSPSSTGTWTETVPARFLDLSAVAGRTPYAGVLLDGSGDIFGTTYEGGTYDYGVVYEVRP